ncbi:MAG: prevent-host-death protein [Acidobacteria bacterium]|nr:MAG: prevent-host-death protein [Acidobacteriota bacterium]
MVKIWIMTTIPFSNAKSHLSEIADRVEATHERILVTRNGHPSFVLINPDDLDALEETIAILRDDELARSLRKSRTEASKGMRLRLKDEV